MSEPEYDSLDSPAAVDEEESDRSSERAGSEPVEQDRLPPASLEDGVSEEESEEGAEEQSVSGVVGEDKSETSEVAREEESGRSDSEGEGERGEEEGEGEREEGDKLEGVEMESSDEENMRSVEAHEEDVSPQAEQTKGRTCMYMYIHVYTCIYRHTYNV